MSKINFSEVLMQHIKSAGPQTECFIDRFGKTYSYGDLKKNIELYSTSIHRLGLKQQHDVICLVPLGFELISCLIACFSMNKTVIFIDPRLGLKNFYKITKNLASADVIHYRMNFVIFCLKLIFKNLNYFPLNMISTPKQDPQNIQIYPVNNPWMIDGFTSGTTGEIKRIRRSHGHMTKAAEIFSQHIVKLKQDRHLIGYTLSAIRNIVDEGTAFEFPKKGTDLYCFIEKNKITRISGPPLTSHLAELAYRNKHKQNTDIKNIVMGGAPAQRWLLKSLQETFPNAIIQNIYGCTECEPISHCRAEDILNYQGLGYYVGHPVKELRCEFEPVDDTLFELVLHGEHVTNENGHKTGDLVRKCSDGGLVLVGRKKYILTNAKQIHFGQYEIETLIENQFAEIKKVAVIQKNLSLFIFIEFRNKKSVPQSIKPYIAKKLNELSFLNYEIRYLSTLPYDQRHHWKVQYHQL